MIFELLKRNVPGVLQKLVEVQTVFAVEVAFQGRQKIRPVRKQLAVPIHQPHADEILYKVVTPIMGRY
ncbi:hypothetical protein SDC9_201929 [bioreactor metagenome]|uniref:Uncharacterized protein n=1 Tax=bioreactor metagenome TaxID=1076179 RepID=A0A645IV15_9ZZZZ